MAYYYTYQSSSSQNLSNFTNPSTNPLHYASCQTQNQRHTPSYPPPNQISNATYYTYQPPPPPPLPPPPNYSHSLHFNPYSHQPSITPFHYFTQSSISNQIHCTTQLPTSFSSPPPYIFSQIFPATQPHNSSQLATKIPDSHDFAAPNSQSQFQQNSQNQPHPYYQIHQLQATSFNKHDTYQTHTTNLQIPPTNNTNHTIDNLAATMIPKNQNSKIDDTIAEIKSIIKSIKEAQNSALPPPSDHLPSVTFAPEKSQSKESTDLPPEDDKTSIFFGATPPPCLPNSTIPPPLHMSNLETSSSIVPDNIQLASPKIASLQVTKSQIAHLSSSTGRSTMSFENTSTRFDFPLPPQARSLPPSPSTCTFILTESSAWLQTTKRWVLPYKLQQNPIYAFNFQSSPNNFNNILISPQNSPKNSIFSYNFQKTSSAPRRFQKTLNLPQNVQLISIPAADELFGHELLGPTDCTQEVDDDLIGLVRSDQKEYREDGLWCLGYLANMNGLDFANFNWILQVVEPHKSFELEIKLYLRDKAFKIIAMVGDYGLFDGVFSGLPEYTPLVYKNHESQDVDIKNFYTSSGNANEALIIFVRALGGVVEMGIEDRVTILIVIRVWLKQPWPPPRPNIGNKVLLKGIGM